MHAAVKQVLSEAAAGKKIETYTDYDTYKSLPQIFYDRVFQYKDAENPYDKPELLPTDGAAK